MKIHTKKFSLKWGLIFIVMACWILPIIIISGITWYYITHNINDQITSTVTSSVSNSVKSSASLINSAIRSSRNASYDPTIKNAYSAYLLKIDDDSTLYGKVTAFLEQQYKYDANFLTAELYFCDNPRTLYYTCNETYNATFNDVLDYQNYVHAAVQNYSKTLGANVGFLNVRGNIYMVRNILGSDYKPYAVLTMQLNTENMFGSIKDVVWEKNATIWLNDTPLVLIGKQLDAKKLGITFVQNSQTFQTVENQSLLYGMTNQSDECSLSYAITVDKSSLFKEFAGFQYILIVIMILIIPLLFVVIWFFTGNVSLPISRLITEAQNIENGDFGVQVNERFHSTEMQYLTDAFNSMSYKLKYQFDRIYKEELALRDARIMALQSQINPHFLNNTLEIINWEARLSDNFKVSSMIEALSTMLDAAMDRKKRPIIHISEEMMYVDAYLYIISERFGKRLTVEKEIDSSLLDLYVPRLILQPIIENAVEHGIQLQQKGTIRIRLYQEDDNLIFEVVNDGALRPEDEKNIAKLLSDDYDVSSESSNNLGIHNVNQRLKIIYGQSSGLVIKMNTEGRTVAKITIDINQTKQ
ncbi:MAG TPA: histidine kinase [Oscillospiraceae bacterium]|nr:histidine kinase [Oscillospiraceae bacterium]